MSSGTRGVAQRVDARVVELEARLLQLGGREHKAERSKVNRELWVLQQPAPPTQPLVAQLCGDDLVGPLTPMQQLAAHWQVLYPASKAGYVLCVRCGAGGEPSCRFHPDARAFAFGTGRFDYGYTSLWDTPHDRWFCCGGTAPECAGCCEEQNRSMVERTVLVEHSLRYLAAWTDCPPSRRAAQSPIGDCSALRPGRRSLPARFQRSGRTEPTRTGGGPTTTCRQR